MGELAFNACVQIAVCNLSGKFLKLCKGRCQLGIKIEQHQQDDDDTYANAGDLTDQ